MTKLTEGFYQVEFSAALPGAGGIVCVENGTARGGDGEFVYSGTVSDEAGILQSDLTITPIKQGAISVFNFGGQAFTLKLSGKADGESFQLSGSSPIAGGAPIQIKGKWVAKI